MKIAIIKKGTKNAKPVAYCSIMIDEVMVPRK
jgi:hypothetical protein